MFERQSPDGEFTGPVEFTGGHPLLLLHTLRSCANEDAEDDDDDDDDDDKDEDTGQVDSLTGELGSDRDGLQLNPCAAFFIASVETCKVPDRGLQSPLP
ncbi:unnamed protein product [Gadus morhua 'NCC']